MQLSGKVKRIHASVTIALNQKAKSMMAEGKSVVNLTVGEPDFPTPQRVIRAAQDAMNRGETKYTPSAGILPLRTCIAELNSKKYGRSYSPSNVVVTSGAKQALFHITQALLEEGDEAVIFSPYWVSYSEMVVYSGGKVVDVPCSAKSGFIPDPSDLAQALSPRTRLVFVNSPGNPTGATYSTEVLQELWKVLEEYPHATIVTDDIYEAFVYDGGTFSSIAMMDEIPDERLVVVNGVSKSYSMTGWRLGYAVGPQDLITSLGALQSQSTSGATSISQWAALEALRGPQDDVHEMKVAFEKRRNRVLTLLSEIDHIHVVRPQGAFYVFPDVSYYLGRKNPADGSRIEDDTDLATYLLEVHGVATVPGEAFGSEGHLRISYAAAEDVLVEGIRRISQGLRALVS